MALSPKRVAIIGGGITGTACTYFLEHKGRATGQTCSPLLIESEGHLGGKVITKFEDGFTLEGGPDSFVTLKPWAVALCQSLGVPLISTPKIEPAVYILSDGKLLPLPMGMSLMVPTRVRPFLMSPLFSLTGKLKMGLDLLIPRKRSLRPYDLSHDESIAEFVRRRLGEEAVHKLAEPLLAGIYAGDVEQLSMAATFPQFPSLEGMYGSLIFGLWMQKREFAKQQGASTPNSLSLFVRPEGGMSRLVTALSQRLNPGILRVNSRVVALHPHNGGYEIQLENGETIRTDAVVMTLHTHTVADWVEAWDADLAHLLRDIGYISTASVSVGFKKEEIAHPLNGFGFVVSRKEGKHILAATWSSTKFPGCAPPGCVLIRAILGGAHQERIVEEDDATLLTYVREDLKSILGIEAQPVLSRVFRWTHANPQYHVGHLARVSAIERQASLHPGLFLTGAPYRGLGVPDCIHQAEQTAERVLDFLAEPSPRSAAVSTPDRDGRHRSK